MKSSASDIFADRRGYLAKHLRKEGLIVMRRGTLKIVNFDKLATIAGFDSNYLHTDGPPAEQHIRRAQITAK